MRKKLVDILRRIPLKIYLFLIIAVTFSFLSNDFGLVDIQKTAIILAAGLDRTEDGYTVTAQISVPVGSQDMGGSSSVEVTGNGKTVSDGFADIYAQTGWIPKLVFCNLILIGEETAKQNVFDGLEFFLRYEYMPDNCLLAVCEGKAEEMLSDTSAIDDTSSFALEKVFSQSAQMAGIVCQTTLKEFAIGYYGASKSGYMPYVVAKEQQGAGSSDSDSSQGGSESSGGGSQGAEEKAKVFLAAQTAAFYQGRMAALLDENETFAFNLIKGNVYLGSISVPINSGDYITMNIVRNKGNATLDMQGAPTARFQIEIVGEKRGSTQPPDFGELTDSTLDRETQNAAKKTIEAHAASLWEKTRSVGCDIFAFKTQLKRKSVEKYREWDETLLSVIKSELKVEIKNGG